MSSKATTANTATSDHQFANNNYSRLTDGDHIVSADCQNPAASYADGSRQCTWALAATVGSVAAVAASVRLRVNEVDDKISYAHGLYILGMGFVFFVALTHSWQTWLLATRSGRAFCGRYRLLRSDALEITNKTVSAIQAITSCVAGLMVCTSSCRRSFLTASHYMSDTYAWFGCAYFVYDMWSMYLVHAQKIADKLYLQRLHKQRETTASTLYDKVGENLRHRAAAGDEKPSLREHEQHLSDDDFAVMLKRLKSVRTDQQPTFVRYCAANPVMTMHHVFLQSFGLYVIVYLRGNFGDCVYGFVYLMEFSTPFVSVRSILSTLQLKDSRAYIVNGLLMLGTFFVCRVVMWPSLYYWYGQMVGLNMFQAIYSLPRTCKIGTAILFLPQIYWFYLMVMGALKVFFPTPKRTRGQVMDSTGGSGSGSSSSNNSTPNELRQSQDTIH